MAVSAEVTNELQERHDLLLARAQAFLAEAAEAATAMGALEPAEKKIEEVESAPFQWPNTTFMEYPCQGGDSLQPHEAVEPPELWPDRVEVWQSSVARFHQGARTSADIAAYADRLGEAAGFAVDAARERSLEALVEAQERELVTLQGAEALERAALRRDEVILASLAEELSGLEAFLRGEAQQPAVNNNVTEDTHADNAAERLLQQLIGKEDKLVEQAKQENEKLRAAVIETGEQIARCEREASLLSDAKDAAKALLTADPENLQGQVESLQQALASVQYDIDVLQAGGREVSNRSVEVAEELNLTEAEVQAERTLRSFAKQRIDIASRAATEQQAIYRLLGPSSSAGIRGNILG